MSPMASISAPHLVASPLPSAQAAPRAHTRLPPTSCSSCSSCSSAPSSDSSARPSSRGHRSMGIRSSSPKVSYPYITAAPSSSLAATRKPYHPLRTSPPSSRSHSPLSHHRGSPVNPVIARAGTENNVKSKEPSSMKIPDSPPSHTSIEGGDSNGEGGLSGEEEAALGKGSAALGLLLVAAIVTVAGLGYVYKDELNGAIDFFTRYLEDAGPMGYVAFTFGYAFLEVLAVPAIPLTMSAGVLFGPLVGTALCSISATMAATISFLIARYLARNRILGLVKGNKKFLAIDKALGKDSFRVVVLLRMSPLLPFSLGNYVYGLTSIELVPYILGSWLGMLPGTYAYICAGAFGRSLLEADEASSVLSNSSSLPLLAGLGVTVAAAAYVTNLAKNAMKDMD